INPGNNHPLLLNPSELMNKSSTSTPNSPASISSINSSLLSLSSAHSSTSSIKSNTKMSPKLNELTSNSNSYNQNNDSSELEQPMKKKQRSEELSQSFISLSHPTSTDEQSPVLSSSLSTGHKEKKKKNKLDKNLCHMKCLSDYSPSSISKSRSFLSDEQYQKH
ncbi:unnamed protein product, partial [Rotaria socialis]